MYELYIDGDDGYQEIGKYQNQYDMFRHITTDPDKKYVYVYDDRVNIPFSSDISNFIRKQREYNTRVSLEAGSFLMSNHNRSYRMIAEDMTKIGKPPITEEHRDTIMSHKDQFYRDRQNEHMEEFEEELKKNMFKDYLH